MAIVMKMNWKEMTRGDYEKAHETLNLDANPPKGLIFHTSWMAKDGLNVLDVWESKEANETFVKNRLMPIVKGQLKIAGEPTVEILPANRYFKPVSPHDCEAYDKTTHTFTA
jgi:hypothetical protein